MNDTHAEPDTHEAFADPAACGLASAILLLFAVLLNRAAGTADVPAVARVDIAIVFTKNQSPKLPFTVSAKMNRKSLFAVQNGVMEPGELFARERSNRAVKVFASDSTAFFRTAQSEALAVSLSSVPMRANASEGGHARWGFGLTIQFPKKADILRFELVCGDGAAPTSIIVKTNNFDGREDRLKELKGGKEISFVVSDGAVSGEEVSQP